MPPVVNQLTIEFRKIKDDPTLRSEFLQKYSLTGDDVLSRLDQVIDYMPDHSRVFSCSWAAKEEECSLMWNSYGDQCRGVALRTTVGKLHNSLWRVPVSLAGVSGGARLHDLIFRKIRYLKFDEFDDVTGYTPEDLYVPFLKRKSFVSEQEWRLLALSTRALNAGGFVLQCDLSALIERIVIGPFGKKTDVGRIIEQFTPNLSDTPIVESTLGE